MDNRKCKTALKIKNYTVTPHHEIFDLLCGFHKNTKYLTYGKTVLIFFTKIVKNHLRINAIIQLLQNNRYYSNV